MSDTEYDVIVAGYGPVGETCANLLGYYGIKALILDKEKETYPLPRAITWDAECQRAMAHCNFLTEVKTRKIRGVDNKDAKKRSILKITMEMTLITFPTRRNSSIHKISFTIFKTGHWRS